ncbi:hypothetical protein L6V77_17065 [Myxococcota bacterium]|nr:hypothetical protein [Myxococcota bacterium]
MRSLCVPALFVLLAACGVSTPTPTAESGDSGGAGGVGGSGATGGSADDGGQGPGLDANPGAADTGALGGAVPPPGPDAGPGPGRADAGAAGGALPPPPADAGPGPSVPDAGPILAPDAGAAPDPYGRVCCAADADCDPGRHCSAGRCFDAPPAGPCGCATDADCPAGQLCLTDDRVCGACVPEAQRCAPACDRNLSTATFAYLAPDPFMPARPMSYTGTLVLDERLPGGVGRRFELALDDGMRQAFAYVLPAPLTLPFALGSRVTAEFSGLQADGFDARASLSGPDGPALWVINRRGADPAEVAGVPFHVEYQGCDPTLIGNCLQASPAALVFDVDGPRSPVAQTGDALQVGRWQVHVARVYRDENACQPDLHDLYANFVMVPVRP